MSAKKKQTLYKMYVILLCVISISCNQQASKNQLLILGTVHFPTNEISSDSIYTILEKYNPDLILWRLSLQFSTQIILLEKRMIKMNSIPLKNI